MAAQTTWPHSTLEKKKKKRTKSVSVNYSVWFKHAYIFFFLGGLMLTLAAALRLWLSVVSITTLQTLVLCVPSRAAECNYCQLFKEVACSFLRLSKCVTKLAITTKQRACLFRSWYVSKSGAKAKPVMWSLHRMYMRRRFRWVRMWYDPTLICAEGEHKQSGQASKADSDPHELPLSGSSTALHSHIWKRPSLCRL